MELTATLKSSDGSSAPLRLPDDSAFTALRRNEDQINEKLKHVAKLDQSSDFHVKYKEVIREILKIVGEALFELTKGECASLKDVQFYFWPGYDSYLNRDKKERVPIISNGEECGIGFDGKGRYYDFAPTKIGFDYFLDLQNKFPVKGKYYAPGGMHEWLSQEKNPLLKPEKGDPIALKILEVQVSKDYATRVNPETGKITIALKYDDSENWGRKLGSFLNGEESIFSKDTNYVVHSKRRWPLAEEELVDEDVRLLREKLYSAWLASCFLSNWKEIKWLDEFTEVKAALSKLNDKHDDLARMNYSGSKLIYSNSFFKHWYSLVVSENVSLEENSAGVHRNELGSVMLLTGYPINGALLYLIKYWIESIYLKLRSIEDQYFIKKKERSETTSKWAHALKTRIEFLKPLVKEVKTAKDEAVTVKSYIEMLDLKIHELANLASAVHEITKENYNFTVIKKELNNYNYDESTTAHNHLNLLLQESMKTALSRVVTDHVYMDYQRAREKIVADNYLTRQEGARTIHEDERNLPRIFLEKSNMQRFLFGTADSQGMINYNAIHIHDFLQFLYKKTKFEGIFNVEFMGFSEEEKENFNRYLTLPEIQSVDIRFPFSALVSLMVDEIFLNAFKYFEKNELGENFIKVIIHKPEVPLTRENIGKLMDLTITIRNTTDKNTNRILKNSQKTSTGLNFIKMCLKLFSENAEDVFMITEDRYCEYNLSLPVVFSREMLRFRR